MIKQICFLGGILFILLTASLSAQNNSNILPVVPYNTSLSPLFANDIIIDDKSERDQRNLSICSAFNGWLYAIYSYYESNIPQASLLRSKDNGLTWNVLVEDPISYSDFVNKGMEIISAGTTLNDFKIYLTFILINYSGEGHAQVLRYNGEPFTGEGPLLYSPGIINDISIATDNFYTPSNASPYCFAMAYIKHNDVESNDSLIFRSSSNGALPDNYRAVVSYTGNFEHVRLAYGKGSDSNSGRFYVVWEAKDSPSSPFGHIYTAHTEPTYNSAFTTPICLDCSDPEISNKCRRPAIACQYGNLDNDSSNITTMILFEHYIQSENKFNIKGYYSRNSTVSGSYSPFTLSSSTNNNQQPDVAFNHFDSTFMVTYFDSTQNKLLYFTKNYNLNAPDSWNTISDGYNDQSNLTLPYPKIKLNEDRRSGFNAWIANGNGNNGIALFDAPYHYYTGISEIPGSNLLKNVKLFPNPCNSSTTFQFDLLKASKIDVSIINSMGEFVFSKKDQSYPSGHSSMNLNTQSYLSGMYYYSFKAGNDRVTGKFIVIH